MMLPPPDGGPACRRRRLLQLLAALPLAPAPAMATAAAGTDGPEDFHGGAVLLVAGPDGGRLDALSRVILPPMVRSLPPGAVLNRQLLGGTDGVTAANQFDTRVAPDGLTVLMVPGAAALAWLAGDPRAQFDTARWVPVMAATTPGVLVSRLPSGHLAKGGRLRIAASTPVGPEMPALLAVDLCGGLSVPLFGIPDPATARDALAQGSVDAVFVGGPGALDELAALRTLGARPLLVFGVPDADGGLRRDPLLPDVPDMVEFALATRGAPPRGPLYAAWQGAAAACKLEFGLVLPQLTPAAMVAVWRNAGRRAAGAPEVRDVSASMRTRGTPAANATISALAPSASALLELRRWLAVRFDWRPA